MFQGTYTNKVDAKGRVSVPADFRTVLAQEGVAKLTCFPSFTDNCLEAGGPAYFQYLHGCIEEFDPYDELRDAFEVSIIGDSVSFNFDKDGRITLTDMFRQVDIVDHVTFVGRGEKFQMWNPSVFDARRADARRLAAENRSRLLRRRIDQSVKGGEE